MIHKLNTSLQTKNILGLTDEALENSIIDPYYEFIRLPGPQSVEAERGGSICILNSPFHLNVKRDYLAIVQPNPELHHFGIVSFNPIIAGEYLPEFVVRAHKAGALELDWLCEVRLLGS